MVIPVSFVGHCLEVSYLVVKQDWFLCRLLVLLKHDQWFWLGIMPVMARPVTLSFVGGRHLLRPGYMSLIVARIHGGRLKYGL